MIYGFSLKTVGLVVGATLIATHLGALWRAQATKTWLVGFPRSRSKGVILVLLAAVWAFWLMATMELGEFAGLRRPVLILIPIASYLTIRYVDEFLSVRALGILAILATEPLLESAFMQPQASRLLLVLLGYLWAIFGLFWIGMPYLLRDQIQWLVASATRWNIAAAAGLAYGTAILVSAILFY